MAKNFEHLVLRHIVVLLVDALGGWCYRSPLVRELERRWYRSRLWHLVGGWWHHESVGQYRRWHVYEWVISNGRLWFKLQASCWSSRQAAGYIEARFNATRYITAEGHRPVTPFRLSDCSPEIANWESVVDQLPEDWDDGDYRIERYPYAWCETLSEDCDCYANGRLCVVCSDYGNSSEEDKKQSKTGNVWHRRYIKELETSVEKHDEAHRKERSRPTVKPSASDSDETFIYPRVPLGQGADRTHVDLPIAAMDRISQMVSAAYYCSIERAHHPYGNQPIRSTVASLNAACEKISTLDEAARRSNMSHLTSIAEHYLRAFQSEECARKAAWGDVEIPKVLYKYMPIELIGMGAPNSLRATQLLALNDDMECNVITMKDVEQSMLEMLRRLREKSKAHLDTDIPWEDLLKERLHHGSPRLSPYIQRYLNPRVGVVSFSTDIYVPTMWAHYARNTGIVVGYDTETLRTLGFELQPVIYSEIAPIYRPLSSDHIELEFVDREYMEGVERTGQKTDGLRVLTTAKLARLGSDWKSLSRLLFVKGMSWAYEKEVRLLVDLKQSRETGESDGVWPIKVIDLPPLAIVEIYGGTNTREADLELAVQVARGGDKSGLLVGRLTSHAFRIQKSSGTRH